jgi:hypothetical protein
MSLEGKVYCLLVVYGKQGKRVLFQYPIGMKDKTTQNEEKKNLIEVTETFLDLDVTVLATMLLPSKKELVNKGLKMSIDDVLFLARPTAIDGGEKTEMTHFTIVLCFNEEICDEKIQHYQNVLKILTKVMMREQVRCQFLTNEINSLYQLKDQYLGDWNSYISLAIKQNELAKEFKSIVESISTDEALQIRVNGWIELCMKSPTMGGRHKTVSPYDACVVLRETPKLNFPVDGIEQVEQIRNLIAPNKTIQEICKKENLSLNMVCSCVSHMIVWGVVRTLPKLTLKSVLHVNEMKLPIDDKHSIEYRSLFPLLPSLMETLAIFHKTKSLSELFELNKKEEWRSQLFKGVCWLLRQNYVFQRDRYIQLVPPPSTNIDLRSPKAKYEFKQIDDYEYLSGITDNVEMRLHFKKIAHYFNGDHHVREILWRESMSMEDMDAILSTFKNILFVYEI